MSTNKHIDRICVVIMTLAIVLTLLFVNGEALGIEKIVDEDAESYAGTEWFTANEQNGDWDSSGATVIALQGDTAKISGGGAYFYNGRVIISSGGHYIVSGTLQDGCIDVDAPSNAKVWILFDGVSISNDDDACLRVDQADKVFLTLAEGSENSLSSGSNYSEEALEDNTGGVVYAHDDLAINGSGSLCITAGYKHGIDANDSLVICGSTISITAPGDGLHANEGVRIKDAEITIEAGDDGIHSDEEFYFEGGCLVIKSCYEGIEAVTIEIAGGDVTIFPEDDGINANGDEKTYIRITGGNLSIVNDSGRDADGLDSNGDIFISGGTVHISMLGEGGNCAVDFGSESGGVAEITGGMFVACGSSSMAEGFSASSSQCSILFSTGQTVEAGTTVALYDADGTELLSYKSASGFSTVYLSCPAMEEGETYTVVCGGESFEVTLDSASVSAGSAAGSFGTLQEGFGGRHGGFMGSRGEEDSMGASTQGGPGMGGRPERPEDYTLGERPEMPEDFAQGRRPEMTEDSQSGETPQNDLGSAMTPPYGSLDQDGPGSGMLKDAGRDVTEEIASSSALRLSDYSSKTWIWLGASAAVLIAGLLFAKRWRRY